MNGSSATTAPSLSNEWAAWLRLVSTPGIGPVSARRLLATFGLPEQVFAQSEGALRQAVSATQARALQVVPPNWAATCAGLATWLAGDAHRGLLTLADPNYPAALLEINDPPALLYWQGRVELLQHPTPLAVVGSRNPTAQGAVHAREFARALGQAGLCIVSGLAQGIDGAAHEGALDVSAPTVAVVGTGLDRVYPAVHRDLAHRVATHGLLLSEFALGTPPVATNFPKRNRLIAGLSQGVLVVEAALASGSLITARMAADMGREVFAIPGSVHAPQAKGCHALIRDGAKLVETARDVLEDLRVSERGPKPTVVPPAERTSVTSDTSRPKATASHTAVVLPIPATDHPVLAHVGHDPIGLDELQARTGWDTARLQAELLNLELDGDLTRLPGGAYQRLVCT